MLSLTVHYMTCYGGLSCIFQWLYWRGEYSGDWQPECQLHSADRQTKRNPASDRVRIVSASLNTKVNQISTCFAHNNQNRCCLLAARPTFLATRAARYTTRAALRGRCTRASRNRFRRRQCACTAGCHSTRRTDSIRSRRNLRAWSPRFRHQTPSTGASYRLIFYFINDRHGLNWEFFWRSELAYFSQLRGQNDDATPSYIPEATVCFELAIKKIFQHFVNYLIVLFKKNISQ